MKAFPSPYGDKIKEGMDLRDYFAAKVMQGFIQASASLEESNEFSFDWAVGCGVSATTSLGGDGGKFNYSWARYYAEEAYLIADAMMKARNVNTGE